MRMKKPFTSDGNPKWFYCLNFFGGGLHKEIWVTVSSVLLCESFALVWPLNNKSPTRPGMSAIRAAHFLTGWFTDYMLPSRFPSVLHCCARTWRRSSNVHNGEQNDCKELMKGNLFVVYVNVSA